MKRLEYLMRHVFQAACILLVIAVVNFILIRAVPGDPASVMAGEAGASDPIFVAQLRERFGLDKPLPVQLLTYVGHVARLDLGELYRQRRPVASLIAERLPATLILTPTAFVAALTFGVTLGAVQCESGHVDGQFRHHVLDDLLRAAALLARVERCCCSRSSSTGCPASDTKRWGAGMRAWLALSISSNI